MFGIHLGWQKAKFPLFNCSPDCAVAFIAILFCRIKKKKESRLPVNAPPPRPRDSYTRAFEGKGEREMPFSTSEPITSFISTWKMRDYFPNSLPAPLMGSLMPFSRNVQTLPSLQLSSTQERANLLGIPSTLIKNQKKKKKRRKQEGGWLFQLYQTFLLPSMCSQ